MRSHVRRIARATTGVVFFLGGVLLLLLLYNSRTPQDSNLDQPWLTESDAVPWTASRQLRIVTYNVHDLYLVSDHRDERMAAIGEALTALDPDLVAVQESFIASDRAVLLDAVANSRLDYSHYFPSGTAGSGLLVLSAYPVEGVAFHRFTRNGKWYKPWHGDWWAGKGIGLVRITVGSNQHIDIYNTHAHAGYGSTEYDDDRATQMQEVASFVRATSHDAIPAVLTGDLNCRRGDPEYDRLVEDLGLKSLNDNMDGIDHILAVSNDMYRQTPSTIVVLDGTLTRHRNAISWSDHNGYSVNVVVSAAPHDEVEVSGASTAVDDATDMKDSP